MNPNSFSEYSASIERLRLREEPFVLATIVKVHGSASAKVGSKAIFDQGGNNIFGWIGGGCAERFVGEQAIESLKEKKGRIVLADLDDEIFGLGVACGGTMEVFIDPILRTEEVELPETVNLKETAEDLALAYGVKVFWKPSGKKILNVAELFLHFSAEFARQREKSGLSLKQVKDIPVQFGKMNFTYFKKSVSIFGSGRIIEALAWHFSLLGWSVRTISAKEQNDTDFDPGECVIIASHSSRDRELVKAALESQPAYVGMVGSRKRALEIIQHLDLQHDAYPAIPLFIPAGLDFDAKNPNEIGLSIVSEILKEMLGMT